MLRQAQQVEIPLNQIIIIGISQFSVQFQFDLYSIKGQMSRQGTLHSFDLQNQKKPPAKPG